MSRLHQVWQSFERTHIRQEAKQDIFFVKTKSLAIGRQNILVPRRIMTFMDHGGFVFCPGHVEIKDLFYRSTETNDLIHPWMEILDIHHRIIPMRLTCITPVSKQFSWQSPQCPVSIHQSFAVKSMH